MWPLAGGPRGDSPRLGRCRLHDITAPDGSLINTHPSPKHSEKIVVNFLESRPVFLHMSGRANRNNFVQFPAH
ncbi:hypothetical protein F2P81_008206 [Scophthalmus maximus]|uniref:Uncharacterized protein n=1 Tax=Scophthalmus maximus TaxID=52904 RepID=A0A6A4TAJ0_SCOMX|nr:hypothetical protein F2P81_008206 [Scophthalmus maximus]